MIDLQQVTVDLAERRALSGITAQIARGTCVGVVGPNGAGKSTLLKAIGGLMPLAAGRVLLEGELICAMSAQARAARLVWLAQSRPVAWNITAEDLVALGRLARGGPVYARCSAADRAAIDQAMMATGAEAFFGRPVQTLSGGECARVHLARCLASTADVLLLDEPFAALDIAHQLEVAALLKAETRKGRTVIASAHDLQLVADHCDVVLVLSKSEVAGQGAPQDVLTDSCLSAVFGVRRGETGRLERVT
jgi:iron complex transport system ATP-binding protein